MAFNFWREFDRGDKAVIVLMVFFFLITSYLGYFNHGKFNSPDESANYFFAKNFALKTSLSVPEPLDLVAPIVHPRSVNVRGSDLVPGSFIGLILFYGHVAKVFGSGAIVFLTPFFASLALGAWYWIIKKLAGQSLAFTSSVIWAIHPALLYYAARGLLPNVLFVSALVLMVFCYLRAGGSSRWWIWAILAGAFFSLAVGVRANEIIWLLPLIAVAIIYFRRVIRWKVWLTFVVSSIIFITPVMYWQKATFGAVFKTGYQSQVAQVVSA
ncbi:glycosyltransferase family 39 protein, partial [Candidatus Uhrbacteria bacterium]|nr:glycosyltransferase family 39 protein [Candidatus Uhrbacteria bacterium]